MAELVSDLIANQPTKQKVRMVKKMDKQGKTKTVAAPPTKLPNGQRKTDEQRQYKSIFDDNGKVLYVQCLYCDFTTKLTSNMPGHLNSKHFNRQIKCEECPFSTYYPKNLAVHMKKLHARVTRRCAVPGCKFRSIEDSRMNNHLVEKHGGMYDTAQNAIFVDI